MSALQVTKLNKLLFNFSFKIGLITFTLNSLVGAVALVASENFFVSDNLLEHLRLELGRGESISDGASSVETHQILEIHY